MQQLAFLLFALALVFSCGEVPDDERAMATRPTQEIHWAESAPDPASDRVFPAAKQTEGYSFEEPFPHEDFNGYAYEVGQHVNYLERSAGQFDYPQLALDVHDFAVGDTVVVPGSLTPGQGSSAPALGLTYTNAPRNLATDGEFVIVVEQANAVGPVYPRVHVVDPSGRTAERVFEVVTSSIFGPDTRVACNGSLIALANGTDVTVVDYDGTVVHAALVHAVEIQDIAMDDDRVYIVSADTGGIEARAYTLATGVEAWTYAHGATLRRVVTDGEYVWVAGEADGSGNTIARLVAGAGTESAVGSAVGASAFLGAKGIALGRDALYIVTGAGTLERVEKWSTMEPIDTIAFANTVREIAVDDQFVYVATDDAIGLHALPADADLRSIWLGWQRNPDRAVVAVGHRVFGIDDSAGETSAIPTGRGPVVMRYAGDTLGASWFRSKFQPGG